MLERDQSRAPMGTRFASLSIAGLTADYTRLPPGTGPSVTAGHAIGVAFTPQRRAVWSVGRGRPQLGRLTPATIFMVPAGGLEWAEWSDVSESIEMWLDPDLLGRLSRVAGGPSRVVFDYHALTADPTVVSVASSVRQSLLSDTPLPESLPPFLARHVLERYRGLRLPRSGRIRKLDHAALSRVAEYIEAHLDRPLTAVDLAAVAGRSPFHFAKAFKAATGASPYAFMAARRMERALVLLQQTDLPVSRIARAVGFESRSHFRSSFRRVWGESTALYRPVGRPRRSRM